MSKNKRDKKQDEQKDDDIVDETTEQEEKITEVIKEIEVEVNVDYKDKWLRAQADYSNLIKETAEKRSEWAAMSEWHILEEFIPVYDNFKLAYRQQQTDYSPEQQKWVDGIGYIMKQFLDILKQHGIEEIETDGAAFDPTQHECLSEESSDEHEDGAIIREVNAGYKKGDRVLKVAGVVINKKTKE
jgi:molecular chaperone GrpE